MTATTTRSGPVAVATAANTFALVAMDQQPRKAPSADEGRRRPDNFVQATDGRARPYTEVTTR
jgi:hypothetical protein